MKVGSIQAGDSGDSSELEQRLLRIAYGLDWSFSEKKRKT